MGKGKYKIKNCLGSDLFTVTTGKKLNIIIVSGHFPPSNLVGVHRARYLTKYLPHFNINPILVTVHEKYYEEKLDYPLLDLIPEYVRVEKVNAFKIGPFRLIGDIGLRGFFQLLSRIMKLIRTEKICFLYITLPSFYAAILGRLVHILTGISYGIDYQDPWVHFFPGSEKKFSKAWWATIFSGILEPFAVKRASLLTGVNEKYYEGVVKRNPHLKTHCQFLSMPIGIDEEDFEHVSVDPSNTLFNQNKKLKLVYAGALLPRALEPFRYFCRGMAAMKDELKDIEIYFIGTGKPHGSEIVSYIKPIAEEAGIWNKIVFEHPGRISYLDTLGHLKLADGILILGSDQMHYSPSKVYQSMLAEKPIFAILNSQSDIADTIMKSKTGMVLPFDGPNPEQIETKIGEYLLNFIQLQMKDTGKIMDRTAIRPFLAKNITKKLADYLNSTFLTEAGTDKKNLLIIYPHWPPSNLAGVHRPRLISNNLPNFNWHPIILTVSHQYYEEPLDWGIVNTVSDQVEVIYTRAIRVMKPRIIGDIGLRGMKFLYREAKRMIESRNIDFIWIPIPSFYTSLLGRRLYDKYQLPYGIDYIDPWIRDISNRRNWRSVLSLWLARILEPIAVKKASLITGVAYEYYKPVLERNFPYLLDDQNSTNSPRSHVSASRHFPVSPSPHFPISPSPHLPVSPSPHFPVSTFPRLQINRSTGLPITHLAFPYGFDPNDYKVKPVNTELPWDPDKTIYPIVYAGAFLPKARILMNLFFQSLKEMKINSEMPPGVKIYFIGTGAYDGETLQKMSREMGIEELIEEKRERLPYLSILHFLKNAYGVMVIGSTEPHYTASKIYQALLSTRPVMALLHGRSQAYEVLREVKGDNFTLAFDNVDESLKTEIKEKFKRLLSAPADWAPVLQGLTKYSAKESAGKLVRKMEEILCLKDEKRFNGRK